MYAVGKLECRIQELLPPNVLTTLVHSNDDGEPVTVFLYRTVTGGDEPLHQMNTVNIAPEEVVDGAVDFGLLMYRIKAAVREMQDAYPMRLINGCCNREKFT